MAFAGSRFANLMGIEVKDIFMKLAKNKSKNKKKIKIFSELRQSLQEAVNFEQGDTAGSRVTELPPPPKPLPLIRSGPSASPSMSVRWCSRGSSMSVQMQSKVGNKASDTREKQP